MIYLILFLLILFFIFLAIKHKPLHLPNFCIITGALKTGKTTLCVHLAIKKYKKVLFSWKIKSFFQKLFKKPISEKPLLYSNIPLKVPYVPLNKALILRSNRFSYKSVVILSEASLVADSQNYRDLFTNENLTYFCKLFAHETKGGYLFADTQNIADVHYAIKRVNNQYIWIHSKISLPFFLVLRVREMVFSAENGTSNNFNEDVEKSTRWLVVPKKVWKKFDCYCYSILTDDLPINTNVVVTDNLKADYIVQVKDSPYLKGGANHVKK